MLHAVSLAVLLQLFNLAGAPPAVVAAAQTEVTRAYRAIGVPVRWQSDRPSTDTHTIHVVLLPIETGDLRYITDTVMGAALRTPAGTGVAYVFYTRVAQQANQHDVSSALVLASAISHELGHLLLGSRGHSPTGLMRACWRPAEFSRAAEGQLRFSAEEGANIRARILELESFVEDYVSAGTVVPRP
jgi:hypothetical protein